MSVHMIRYNCGSTHYTIQYRTVLIIFPLVLQTIITTQLLHVKGKGAHRQTHKLTLT